MMSYFALVDAEGWVVKWAGTDDPDNLQVPEGLTAHPAPTRKPPPGGYEGSRLKFVDSVLAWVDVRTLAAAKERKNSEINAARLAVNSSSFTFAGKQIACDPLSRGDIEGANGLIVLTGALPPGWPGAWKAVDNTYVSIPDVAAWTAFYGAMVAQGMTHFAHSQALKALLSTTTTTAEVDAIQWGMVL